MKQFAAATLAALALAGTLTGAARAETISVAPFGNIAVYRPAVPPKSMTLFLSGDGGWELGVVPMAKKLADQGAIVLGVNTPKFLAALDAQSGQCTDPAGELTSLAKTVAAKEGIKVPPPVVVGYSSGATIAYTVLVQSPTGFSGGIGLGFCPDLESVKPMCGGPGGLTHVKNPKAKGFIYGTTPKLGAPFVALQGGKDQVCMPKATDAFISKVKNARVADLPLVGHGFSVPKNWMPQYVDAYRSITGGQKEAAQ